MTPIKCRMTMRPTDAKDFVDLVSATDGISIVEDIPISDEDYGFRGSRDELFKTMYLKDYVVRFRSKIFASQFVKKHGRWATGASRARLTESMPYAYFR